VIKRKITDTVENVLMPFYSGHNDEVGD